MSAQSKRRIKEDLTPQALNNSAQGNTLGKSPNPVLTPEGVEYEMRRLYYYTLSGLMNREGASTQGVTLG
jgi:hypothetical protein